MTRPAWADTLAAALGEQERSAQVVAQRPGIGARAAAVLALIGEGERGPEILFVERASTLRQHANQIAFPGGAADPEDLDLVDTALREATEETGVDRAGVDVLGLVPAAHVAASGFDVSMVVAWWRERSQIGVVDRAEIESVWLTPVRDLTDPAKRARVSHPSGYTGPAFEVGNHLIWGLTAHLVDGVLDLAGWQRPYPQDRFLEIPARYLTDGPGRADANAH